ncbi:MAG: hypothetical protein ACP5NF_10370 [Thermoanaerobaculum sp.]
MVFEWYSGSDPTGRIARRYAQLAGFLREKMALREWVGAMEELVGEERDPNMRGKFLARMADECCLAGDRELGLVYARRALESFDLMAGNFLRVVPEYVMACGVVARWLLEEGDDEELINHADAVWGLVLWGMWGKADRYTLEDGIGLLSYLLATLSEREAEGVIRRLALATAVRWHHMDSEDPRPLAVAAEMLSRLGDRKACEAVLEMLREIDFDGDQYAAVKALADGGSAGKPDTT